MNISGGCHRGIRSVLRTAARYECVPLTFDAGRRIGPAHEAPRNESNNNAHEPTSGRSIHYGSGRLIRVFRDIGHILSSLYPSLAVLFLSRFAPRVGLVALGQTFVRRCHAADRPSRGLKDEQWPPLQSSPAVRSTIPPGHRARLHGGEKRHTRTRVLLHLDFRVQSDCPDGHLSLVVNSSNPPLVALPSSRSWWQLPLPGESARGGRRKRGHAMEAKMSSTGGIKICQ